MTLDLKEGLNIITGETGAGKSILLGAISMLLGGKNEKNGVRDSSRNSIIEGVFEIEPYHLEELFAELDLEYDHSTIIRRVIMPSGKSRAYINDLPVTAQTLQAIGESLVDIHSQHQSILIAKEEYQLSIVDSVAATAPLLEEYTHQFTELKRLTLRLSKLKDEMSRAVENQDFIKFQYNELFISDLKSGELSQLEENQKLLSNATQIGELLYNTNQILSQKEESVLAQIKQLASSYSKFGEIIPSAASIEERLTSVLYELKDIDREVSLDLDRIEVDPSKLESVEQRIDTLYSLMNKHKVSTIDSLIEIREDLERQIKDLDLGSFHIEQCEKQLEKATQQCELLAAKIGEKRVKATPEIENYVVSQLQDLGIENCNFKIDIQPSYNLLPTGKDRLLFLFSANKGRRPEPLGRVASGGEISRLMLSLKSLTALHKSLPTIIFDEIDTGVSGRVADKMGEIMEQLGKTMQVVCITHLPQVAAKGKTHFFVSKNSSTTTTTTQITPLQSDSRVEQIATMISGDKITAAALEQAKLLLKV